MRSALPRPVVWHIPVCPFSQRLEILLELKGRRDAVDFREVDITRPRDPRLLELSGGTTALPVLEDEDGRGVKESLVLLRYLEDRFPDPPIARADPYERAVGSMLIAHEGPFGNAGYAFVMNQDGARREAFREAMVARLAGLDAFLRRYAPDQDFLFDRFGLAEAVFTPLFMRFWFLDWYEGFDIPVELARVRRWRDACVAHPAAQQVSYEQIVKLYYDYSRGAGNGALVAGRRVSSFAPEFPWPARPMPPRAKGPAVDDEALGLA